MSLDLSRLEKHRPSGGKTIARCPACAETGGDSAADHLFINSDGKFGCVLYQSTEGIDHRKRIFELAGNAESKPSAEKPTWNALPSAPESAPFPSLNHYKHGTPSAHWIYLTPEGRIAGIVARFDLADGKKEVLPLAWCRDESGNTGWRWKSMPEPRPLYGLPFGEDFVVIVEGEKTAEAVIAAGLPATTWAGGSGAVGKADWQPLAGKIAIVWPDNDEPGQKASAEIVRKLSGIAAEVRLVAIPPGMPVGWDAADTDPATIRFLVDNAAPIGIAEVPSTDPQPFPITRACDMGGIAEAADFVEGLLTDGGASVVYGPSNCGKSFWVLDLAAAIVSGTPFRDELEVEPGAVVYVALEGSHGARNRIEALKRAGRLPANAPLFLCFAPVSLLETGHDKRLAATVKQAAEQSATPCRLVILDTLARAMAGGDENKGQDMTLAVKCMDSVREATGAHVLLVHHCGKDEAKGARGHSSLRAAVDTEIEVSRPEGATISTVRVTKQRDLPHGEAMPFSLESVTLGTDRRGKPITSCVVRHEDEMMASKPTKAGRKPTCTAEDMLRYLPAATVKEWQERVNEETGLGQSQFYTHKATLETKVKFRRETATNRIIAV
jgi:hypothetical protein